MRSPKVARSRWKATGVALAAMTATLAALGPINAGIGASAEDTSAKAAIGVAKFSIAGKEYKTSLLAMSASVTRPDGAGKAAFAFSIDKPVDELTPQLFLMAASGQKATQVFVRLAPTGGTYTNYFLNDVLVSGIKDDVNSVFPQTEHVTFTFSSITWSYVPVGLGTVQTGWDLQKNKAL